MAKVYCMQVEILLTASDITYQAVKHRSVRAVWQKIGRASCRERVSSPV